MRYLEYRERGDEMKKTFDQYAADHSADLTRVCISLCGNMHDAEDLFQETWLRALKGFDTYQDDRTFDKWLFSICVNAFKSRLRLFYNRKRFEFATDDEKQAFFDSLPDKVEEAPDVYYELHSAIMTLPKKLRAVIVLYYFRERSISDVAQILNIPEGTVKSRLHSARQQIKRRLERE